MGKVWIGCAGWTLPRDCLGELPGPGTHLERYGRVYPAVELNTTFYRPHRPETFERWAASVPAGFRFSLKTPRAVTHFRRLKNTDEMLAELEIARVAADPPRAEIDAQPGGWPELAYFRLHGSPRMYFSAYDDAFLDALARRVRRLRRAGDVWVIFDNTATRAAADNARSLVTRLAR